MKFTVTVTVTVISPKSRVLKPCMWGSPHMVSQASSDMHDEQWMSMEQCVGLDGHVKPWQDDVLLIIETIALSQAREPKGRCPSSTSACSGEQAA